MLPFMIATWFGSGLIRPAPGTWGSLAALPFGLFFLWLHPYVLYAAIIVITGVGIWAVTQCRDVFQEDDAPQFVVDEVAGMWLALTACSLSFIDIILAFCLFRILDISKPWPIRILQRRVKGAIGVMIDDIAAGAVAAFFLLGIQYYAASLMG